jgi:FkbM family methyltransferase
MKSLIKLCLIQTLGYQRFLVGTYWMRRLLQLLRGQRSEFVALASLTEPGTLILDVGANIGYVSAALATVPGAQVYAYEPDADNFACLVHTLGGRPNVVVQRIAIGAADGDALLQEIFDHGVKQHALSRVQLASGSQTSGHRVLVRSIDSMRASMNGQIGLIKLDVEGSECDVLRGMMTSVRASRPLIHAEICGRVAIDAFNRFCSMNTYAPYKWRARRFQPVVEIAGGGNFLLVPREREVRAWISPPKLH